MRRCSVEEKADEGVEQKQMRCRRVVVALISVQISRLVCISLALAALSAANAPEHLMRDIESLPVLLTLLAPTPISLQVRSHIPSCTSIPRVHLSAQCHLPDRFGDVIWPARRLGPVIMLELDPFQSAGFISSTYCVVYSRVDANTPCRSPIRKGSIQCETLKFIGT